MIVVWPMWKPTTIRSTGFSHLFATATPLFSQNDDHSGFPALKAPKLGPFLRRIFTDFKRREVTAGERWCFPEGS
jgi:hypothetical protein